MTVDELLERLKKLNIILTGRELAEIWNMSEENVSRMKNGNKMIKAKYLEILEKKFDITLIKNNTLAGALMKDVSYAAKINNFDSDIIKIPYWEGLPDELKIPDFTCVTAERNVIKSHWYLNPETLCIVPMVGNKMENYWYKINDNDILIIDTSHNFIMGNGVYFATSQNNTRFWIREMQILVNNDVEFKGFAPSGNTTRVMTKKQLEDVDFKIIGKVIKNVSFRL